MKRCVIGVDEAGYGPNLGPLVIAATAWQADDDIAEDAFFDLLECILQDDPQRNYRGMKLGDSKQVYQAGKGLAELERSVLVLLAGLGLQPATFAHLLNDLGVELGQTPTEEPWYFEQEIDLPVACDALELAHTRECCLSEDIWKRVGLTGLRVRFVTPAQFNRQLAGEVNKAVILSTQSLGLVDQLLSHQCLSTGQPVKILMDRHGGRKTYADLLTHQFGEFTFVLEESPRLSRYRLDQTEFEFHVQGERFLPVALASMIAKYVRELAMLSFNRYWQSRLAGLKSTAGYPGDARRYFEQIEPLLSQQQVQRELIWRAR